MQTMTDTTERRDLPGMAGWAASVLGLSYLRLFAERLSPAEAGALAKRYAYVFIYSYDKLNFPGFHVKEQRNGIIDLRQPLEEMFKRFRKNTRNEIRKTERVPGLELRAPDPDADTSYRLYRHVKTVDDGVIADIRQDFAGCLFFNAYLRGELVVSMSCYDSGTTLRLKHIVSRRKERGYDPMLMGAASRRLIWEICRYGEARGRAAFDLAGMNVTDPAKRGISAFKESFAPTLATVYTYRYQSTLFTIVKEVLRRVFRKNIN